MCLLHLLNNFDNIFCFLRFITESNLLIKIIDKMSSSSLYYPLANTDLRASLAIDHIKHIRLYLIID